MITGTRQMARELEDGSLEVIVHVHAQHKAAFFDASPRPGGWVSISPAEKPATQGAAASGTEAPPPPMAASKRPSAVTMIVTLARNPWFQEFADSRGAANVADQGDAERRALNFARRESSGIGGMLNDERIQKLVSEFHAWCDSKGYKQDA